MFRELVIAKRQLEDESKRDLVLAWNIAALSRQPQLPDVKTLLNRRKRQERQSMPEQRATLATLSARYGIPLQQVRLIPKPVADAS